MAGNSPRTILVVDDEQQFLDLVVFLLEGEGYRALTALNGQEGLEAVEREMPDLILLDMKMPVMDGWQFAREFHARHAHRVPIVVLTAAEDARKRAEEVGAAGWVGKPFDLDTLLGAVGRHIRAGS